MASSPLVDVDVRLGDNDGQAPPASSTESEVNAIFADMENDADLSYKPLAPSLDLDALRREADARHAKDIVPMTSISQNILAGSSSMRDTKGKEDERKEKRIMPKLDEARLLGPDGFPKLIKDTKHFKPKGKGHEEADLNRLLRIYQFWTHKLYPKTQFRDTVERVEKLCHSRRMHVALSVWRDEARGIVHDSKLQDTEGIAGSISDDDHVENSGNDINAEDINHNLPLRTPQAPSETPSSPVPSRPPSSASEPDSTTFGEDFDIDAFVREEEERAAALATQTAATIAKYTYGKGKGREGGSMDEDEMMWDELQGSNDVEPPKEPAETFTDRPQASNKSAANLFDDDEDMWDAVDQSEVVSQPASTKISQVPLAVQSHDDDWDEMYL